MPARAHDLPFDLRDEASEKARLVFAQYRNDRAARQSMIAAAHFEEKFVPACFGRESHSTPRKTDDKRRSSTMARASSSPLPPSSLSIRWALVNMRVSERFPFLTVSVSLPSSPNTTEGRGYVAVMHGDHDIDVSCGVLKQLDLHIVALLRGSGVGSFRCQYLTPDDDCG